MISAVRISSHVSEPDIKPFICIKVSFNFNFSLNQLAISFNQMAISLADVEKRRQELIGDLTHELRTPLT